MATANLPPGAMPVGNNNSDPFFAPSTPAMDRNGDGVRQRYGGFDSAAFSMFATGSPAQAKRALEAHIAETERRLQETSRIGQVLLSQRNELADRLKEVEGQQADEVNPALKARLLELENEFNHVNRETARIFVGKNRVPSGEAPERDVTEYGGVAHPSPSKAHAPSRKQRNQQQSRVNDLQLATDISAELLEQVRILQASLAEKDALLKEVVADKTQLEADLDYTRQRVKALDESETRYKDENWALETQLHELTATHKDATNRESRLNQSLTALSTAKAALEREFEDTKQAHAKLTEDHAAARKQHEAELVSLKKNATQDETQITGLHKKVEELTSQNKELAQAFAYRLGEASRQVSGESAMSGEGIPDEYGTPEDSPPGSPSKATPRHGALHEETTKSALNHAYRTIQNLKNQLHREKTEKMEYRRLLQDSRDELESKRNGVDSGKKQRKTNKDQELFKKPSRPDRLGEARSSKEEIEMVDDEDWEDDAAADTPSKRRIMVAAADPGKRESLTETSTDAYATATEHSDAFETANEKEGTATESEAFQTGAETLDGDSDLTETEAGTSRGRAGKRPGHAHRMSFQSTASTSADEFDDNDIKTPIQSQASKFKIRVNRGGQRRMSGRETASEATRSFEDSPGGMSSNNSTPMGQGQSLFAELGDLSDAETEEGTPASSKLLSPITSPDMRRSSPAPSKLRESTNSAEPLAQKPVMVDAGIMTEPWEPESNSALDKAADAVGAVAAGAVGFVLGRQSGSGSETDTVRQPEESKHLSVLSHETEPVTPVTPVLTDFPQPPAHTTSSIIAQESAPIDPQRGQQAGLPQPDLILEHNTPMESEQPRATVAPLSHSTTLTQQTAPVESVVHLPLKKTPELLSFSSTIHQDTAPLDAVLPRPSTATKVGEAATAGAGAGFLGGLLGRKKSPGPTVIAEDETSQPARAPEMRSTSVGTSTDRIPLRQIEANTQTSPERTAVKDIQLAKIPTAIQTNNEATQTLLSADQLDRLLRPVPVVEPTPQSIASPTRAAFATGSPRRSRDYANTQDRPPIRRPGSAGSHRSRDRSPMPPLPADAPQVIAAATTLGGKPSSSASSTAPPQTFGTIMGPPSMPASAYRAPAPMAPPIRPQTPQNRMSQQATQSPIRQSVTINAPRPGTASRSQVAVASPTTTRRSSVSSFASELDHRFNISSQGPYDNMFNDGQATDPRMIQAITNTMIGEYLYKYTRKTGSKDVSNNRHRRFFWLHPYTRTLYWSDHDPTTTGGKQSKSKSLQIEAVRIVTDDNPMPPGLHRKSLVVITKGRTIKFTAPTAQRHETWSNALTYLLLKTGAERDVDSVAATEDAEEFNPTLGARSQSRATGRSRRSISSYMSRTTNRTQSTSRHDPTLRASSAQAMRSQSQNRASLSNRLSAIAGSIASRHSRQNVMQEAEIEEHNPHDSAEDLRRVIEQQERDADRLENVRACCDGKHDVASLSRTTRHSRQISARGHTHTHSHSQIHAPAAAAPPPRSISRNTERKP